MKKIVIAASLAICASFNAQAADPATVNGVAVKQSLLDFIIKSAAVQGKKVDDNGRSNIIEKLITNEVIAQEAQNTGITKQPDFIAKEQLTLQELRVSSFFEDYIRKHPVDDATLQSEYDRLKAQSSAKEYKASHILVKTEDEAKDIIARLAKGADFAQLAKEKSIDSSKDSGGDLGWFTPDSIEQPLADATVELKKGDYSSAPIHTSFGWHVIRLEDTRDAQPPSFDSVKEQIRGDLQRQQLGKLVHDLRAKATIVNNTPAK